MFAITAIIFVINIAYNGPTHRLCHRPQKPSLTKKLNKYHHGTALTGKTDPGRCGVPFGEETNRAK